MLGAFVLVDCASVEQSIRMGVFVGGANLRLVEEEKAKKKIAKLKLAKQGTCSKPTP